MSTPDSMLTPGRHAPGRPLLAALLVAGLAFGIALLPLALRSDHIDLPGLYMAIGLFVGWSFIGVGLYAWWRRPDNRFGALMVMAGFAWFLAGLEVSEVAVLFSLGWVLGVLYLAVIVHLLLAFPSGRLESEHARNLAIGVYVVALVLVLAGILFLDPANVGCEECPDNAFLVHESQTAFDVIEVVTSLLGLVLVAEVARTLLRRWREAAPRRRRAMAPVLAAGGLVSLAFGAGFVFDVAGLDDVATAFDLLALLGVIAVPWCFLVGLARTALTRGGAVGDLVARLRGALGPDTVRGSLAAALGDDSLQLAYWLPERERYVDAAGHDLPEELEAGRTATPVELEGRRVGALVHDARLLEEPELVRAVADAAALAFERERLDAELRYTVEELRASRARIVEAGYAAARRLERDLHDGAQQRLVSLALTLRLAEGRIADDPDAAESLVAGARAELAAAIDELRDFARGLHPGILADRGLDAALAALASRAPMPVAIEGSSGGRLAPGIESAAYFVVSEALTNVAKYAEAEHATVLVRCANGSLLVEVSDDGVGGANPAAGSGLRGLSDRVAALDGRLEVQSHDGRGTVVRAAIPVG